MPEETNEAEKVLANILVFTHRRLELRKISFGWPRYREALQISI